MKKRVITGKATADAPSDVAPATMLAVWWVRGSNNGKRDGNDVNDLKVGHVPKSMVMVMKYLSSNRWNSSRAVMAVVHDTQTTTMGSSTASHRGRFHTNSRYSHVLYLHKQIHNNKLRTNK